MPPKQARAAKPKGRSSLRWHLTEATLPPPDLAERVPELAGVEHNPWFVMLMSQHTRTPRRIRPARLIATVLAVATLLLYPIARFIAHPDYPANLINREFMPGDEFFGIWLTAFAYGVLGCLWMARVFFSPAPGANPFRRIIRRRPELVHELYEINSDPDEIARAVLAYHLTMSPRHVWIRRLWLITVIVLPMSAVAGWLRDTLSLHLAFIIPLFLVIYRWQLSPAYERLILTDVVWASWPSRPRGGFIGWVWSGFRSKVITLLRYGMRAAIIPGAIFAFLGVLGNLRGHHSFDLPEQPTLTESEYFWPLILCICITALLAGIVRWRWKAHKRKWDLSFVLLLFSGSIVISLFLVSIFSGQSDVPYVQLHFSEKPTFILLLSLLVPLMAWLVGSVRVRWISKAENANWSVLASQYGAYFSAFSNQFRAAHESDDPDDPPDSRRLIPRINQIMRVMVWHFPRKAVTFGLIMMAFEVYETSFHYGSFMYQTFEFARRKEFSLWDGINAQRYNFIGAALIIPNQASAQVGNAALLISASSARHAAITDFLHALHPNYMLQLWLGYDGERKSFHQEILSNLRVQQFTEELQLSGMARNSGLQNVNFESYRALQFLTLLRSHLDKDISLPKTLRRLTLNECRGDGTVLLHPETTGLNQLEINGCRAEVVGQFFNANQIQCRTVMIWGAKDLPNLNFFNLAHQIDFLDVSNARGLLSLDGIDRIKYLQSFKLIPDRSSTDENSISKIDISALARCKSLRKIDMSGFYLKNIEELRLFSEMESLETLIIPGGTVINNPSPKQHVTLQECLLDEARYIENKIRLAQQIEEVIAEVRSSRYGTFLDRF